METIVRPDELFFSTTDRLGRIRAGNSVFVRISQFSIEELIGAPHNIVRHPDMPAGAFQLMWDRLLSGRVMGAYVKNLARDGSHYWVFATISPMGDGGFLSVRMAPATPLIETAKQVYAAANDAERAASGNDGTVARRDVAQAGLRRIEESLTQVGQSSYQAWLLDTLPAEMAARGRLASTSYARSGVRGTVGTLLGESTELEGMLTDLVGRLDHYRSLSERLISSSARMLEVARSLDRMVTGAQRASERVTERAPVLANIARVMAVPMHTAVVSLERLVPVLVDLRENVARLRFDIALATLHTEMVASFAAEVADGVAPPDALEEVPRLCDTVHDGVVHMAATARTVDARLQEVAVLASEASARLGEFHRFMGQWRLLVLRHRVSSTLEALLGPIDEELVASQDGIALLATLAREFATSAVGLDANALQIRVDAIRAAARD
jgi:aerotaxis receptor